jgi:putative membrane protein
MYWYQWSFFGMHFLWWMLWIGLLIVFFGFATPVPRRRMRLYEHPLVTLSRRYAAGEITTLEYDERRARLEHDLQDVRLGTLGTHPMPPPPPTPPPPAHHASM